MNKNEKETPATVVDDSKTKKKGITKEELTATVYGYHRLQWKYLEEKLENDYGLSKEQVDEICEQLDIQLNKKIVYAAIEFAVNSMENNTQWLLRNPDYLVVNSLLKYHNFCEIEEFAKNGQGGYSSDYECTRCEINNDRLNFMARSTHHYQRIDPQSDRTCVRVYI